MSFVSIAIGMGVGLGVGTAGSLITQAAKGQGITLKDTLMGAGIGAATGGAGAGLGAAAGALTGAGTNAAATGATELAKTGATELAKTGATEAAKTGATEAAKAGVGETLKQAGSSALSQAQPSVSQVVKGVAGEAFANAPKGIPGASALGAEPVSSATSAAGGVPPVAPSAAPSSGVFGTSFDAGSKGANTAIEKAVSEVGLKGLGEGYGSFQQGQMQKDLNKGYRQNAGLLELDAAKGQNMANTLYGDLPNAWKLNGMAHGGEVNLKSGQFVIPADVVSALGNGDTESGQKFLTEFFNDR